MDADTMRTNVAEYQKMLIDYVRLLNKNPATPLALGPVTHALNEVVKWLRAGSLDGWETVCDTASRACDEAYEAIRDQYRRRLIAQYSHVPEMVEFVAWCDRHGLDVITEFALLFDDVAKAYRGAA